MTISGSIALSAPALTVPARFKSVRDGWMVPVTELMAASIVEAQAVASVVRWKVRALQMPGRYTCTRHFPDGSCWEVAMCAVTVL